LFQSGQDPGRSRRHTESAQRSAKRSRNNRQRLDFAG
jgi:hypothetical protein